MNSQAPAAVSGRRSILPMLALFFLFSGASSLIFETVFTRLLTYTFGNTAHTVSTVLAAFLGGLALGAFLVGRWVDQHGASVWTYGVLELLVGIYGLFIPRFLASATHAYVGIYHLFELSSWSLAVVRFGLAAAVIFFPALLIGASGLPRSLLRVIVVSPDL